MTMIASPITAQELYNKVNLWVDRSFNFIQVEVLEKMSENGLHEYIDRKSVEDSVENWLDDYTNSHNEVVEFFQDNAIEVTDTQLEEFSNNPANTKQSFISVWGEDLWDEFHEWCVENRDSPIEDMICENEDYPMWNTCFEFRDSYINDEQTDAIRSVGLGIIDGLEPFNRIVFMTSAGHSFFSAYWIPLYFKFRPTEAEKYAGINYSDL
jgi:hypothetical protein